MSKLSNSAKEMLSNYNIPSTIMETILEDYHYLSEITEEDIKQWFIKANINMDDFKIIITNTNRNYASISNRKDDIENMANYVKIGMSRLEKQIKAVGNKQIKYICPSISSEPIEERNMLQYVPYDPKIYKQPIFRTLENFIDIIPVSTNLKINYRNRVSEELIKVEGSTDCLKLAKLVSPNFTCTSFELSKIEIIHFSDKYHIIVYDFEEKISHINERITYLERAVCIIGQFFRLCFPNFGITIILEINDENNEFNELTLTEDTKVILNNLSIISDIWKTK